jgi:hypothetical protein
MSLIPQPRYTIKVSVNDGRITPNSPLTIKNQIRQIPSNTIASIEDILDVDTVEVVDGSTIVYNSTTDKYEVKKLPTLIDLGTF